MPQKEVPENLGSLPVADPRPFQTVDPHMSSRYTRRTCPQVSGCSADGSGSGGAPAAWLAGTSRVTLLGDALHPMSPFKGQVCHLTTSSVHEH